MDWKYGLTEQERAFGTVVEWKDGKGIAVVDNFKGETQITIRDEEIMFPCGPYFIPTAEVGKNVALGDVLECLLVETEDGLMGLGARKVNEVEAPLEWGHSTWAAPAAPPRLIGVVQHWNFEKSFGFIKSDNVRTNLFFHRREVLVPYEWLNDPSKAVTMKLSPGNLVTFDAISTPRGMRALAVRHFKGQ
jgi:cold shock CspA family protein